MGGYIDIMENKMETKSFLGDILGLYWDNGQNWKLLCRVYSLGLLSIGGFRRVPDVSNCPQQLSAHLRARPLGRAARGSGGKVSGSSCQNLSKKQKKTYTLNPKPQTLHSHEEKGPINRKQPAT